MKYAPNMTRDNVIALRVYGPDEIERKRPDMLEGGYSSGSTMASQVGRFRPVPELSGYRMLLDNLYNCSANMHSGSGIGRGSSLQLLQRDRRRPRARRPTRARPMRVLVTGAARGLGRAFAEALEARGDDVLGVDIADGCDVTREADCEAAVAEAVRRFGGLDGLVNNAGIVAVTRAPAREIPSDEWDRVMDVNAKGTWLMTRAAIGAMGDGGSIVNLASETAYSGSRHMTHYVASKAAVIGLTRAFARELGPAGSASTRSPRATPTPRAAAGSATRTPTTSPPPRSAASRSRPTWSARCSTCSTRAARSSPARSCSSTAGASRRSRRGRSRRTAARHRAA